MNSKKILLDKFRENQSKSIDASDLRIFVEAIYDEFLLMSDVIDRDDVIGDKQVSSISQVTGIRDDLSTLEQNVTDMAVTFPAKADVYSKTEADVEFVSAQEITGPSGCYTKQETYSKQEIASNYVLNNDLLAIIQDLERRIIDLENK